jgi:uncharacterized membrane protein YgdD (TMEM256/DUF423 family)
MSSQPLLNNPSAPQARSIYFRVAAAYGATAVILGAFGAHGLKKRIADPARLANWGTAAQYQVRFCPELCRLTYCTVCVLVWHTLLQCLNLTPLEPMQRRPGVAEANPEQAIHSIALLVASSVAPENTWSARLFTAGMTMFSGSLYFLVLDPARFRFMGPVTPLGGLCLIGGWAALGLGR